MKIGIPDDYLNTISTLDCFSLLQGHELVILNKPEKDPEKLASLLAGCEALILTRERTEITEELLRKLPELRLISQTGKISSHLNLGLCSRYNVSVAEGVGSPIAPAELTWTLLLNTIRQVPQSIESMKQGKWQISMGSSIYGKTLGIWGYGKIGQKIAQYAKVFGAKVLVWGSESSRQKAVADGFEQAENKEYLFSQADIVSIHLRLTESTFGIVKETDLLAMKENSVLINTARAELIEPGALLKTLQGGKKFFVGIDVYEKEPIYDATYALLQMPNVVCTPHLGYVEKNGFELYFRAAFENVINFINGNPTHIANLETLK